MSKKILIVDDEIKIVEICRDYLQASGFLVASETDGQNALAVFRQQQPDLVILDLMLPNKDGLDICREIRHESTVPIIMLTARIEESDKLVGLELGADDYITKPFSPRELVARVRTIFRRVQTEPTSAVIRCGGYSLDRNRFTVMVEDKEIALTPTEFEIMATLANQPGRIFTRGQLLVSVRGVAFESYERAIDSHIRNLRKKLDMNGLGADCIVTVHGVGYKFADSGDS